MGAQLKSKLSTLNLKTLLSFLNLETITAYIRNSDRMGI